MALFKIFVRFVMPTLIACRHSPTYRKAGLKPPLQPPNGGTPTAKIHSFSLSGKFFRLKSAPCKGNGRSPLPHCPKVERKTQRAAQAITPHCTRHRSALHRPSHRTAPAGAKRKAGFRSGVRPGCECYARGVLTTHPRACWDCHTPPWGTIPCSPYRAPSCRSPARS